MISRTMRNFILALSLTLLAILNICGIFTRDYSWPFIQDFSMYGGNQRYHVSTIRKLFIRDSNGQLQEITDRLNINDDDTIVKILRTGLRTKFFSSEMEYLKALAESLKNSKTLEEIRKKSQRQPDQLVLRIANIEPGQTELICIDFLTAPNLTEYCVSLSSFEQC